MPRTQMPHGFSAGRSPGRSALEAEPGPACVGSGRWPRSRQVVGVGAPPQGSHGRIGGSLNGSFNRLAGPVNRNPGGGNAGARQMTGRPRAPFPPGLVTGTEKLESLPVEHRNMVEEARWSHESRDR